MANGVSVLICTYNGKSKLALTLQHLAVQQGTEGFGLEVLLIDNASTDGTAEFALQKWKELKTAIPLTVISEPRAGKTNATETGIKAARYGFIIICDDDNWLCSDYVSRAYAIMSSNTAVGVLGGKGIAVFEAEEPEWFKRHTATFAVGRQYNKEGDVTDQAGNLWGAGMVLRKDAWQKIPLLGYQFFLNYDGTGTGNWGGEDVELFETIKMMGYRIWYDEHLTFKHYMPRTRVTYDYLKSKYYGAGRIRVYIQAFIYCRTHNQIPGEHLKYPLWLDKWQYKLREYIREWPGHLFESKTNVSDSYLKFIARKGELHELFLLKGNYTKVFEKILALKNKSRNQSDLQP